MWRQPDHRRRSAAAPRVRVPAALEQRVGAAAERLAAALERELGELGELVLTDNRSTIYSVRPSPAGLRLRVHWSFAGAPESVIAALADAIGGPPAARRRALHDVRQHFDRHRRRAPARAPAPRPAGACFDLAEIRDRLNREYFGDRLRVDVAWGRRPSPQRRRRRRGRRSIHLGTYRADLGLIRIHPVLDRPEVPLYVVEAVMHHEMLHAALPALTVGGRRRLHTPEFRRRERLFADHARARAWIDAHLDHLLAERYR